MVGGGGGVLGVGQLKFVRNVQSLVLILNFLFQRIIRIFSFLF
jgi:hypothetical protein